MNSTLLSANADLHKWLYEQKLTQSALAKKLGVHPETIRRYLRHSSAGWPLRTAHVLEELTGIAAERLSPDHPKHGEQE